VYPLYLHCLLALGKLRAAVGKAQLLTSKKFKQFRELCHSNLVSACSVNNVVASLGFASQLFSTQELAQI